MSAVLKLARLNREEGLAAAGECAVRMVGAKLLGMGRYGHPRINVLISRLTDLAFDGWNGTDTGGVPNRLENSIGKGYMATPPRVWKLIVARLPRDLNRFTFLDFGCGKGRVLLLAARSGFEKRIGVELSAPLLACAERNLAKRQVSAELTCCDVRTFKFPEEPMVLFMYNPFPREVMEIVAANLAMSLREDQREAWVVLYSAGLKGVWVDHGFEVFREADFAFPNYAILRFGDGRRGDAGLKAKQAEDLLG